MSNMFRNSEVRDAYQFRNGLIPIPFSGSSLCRYLHANEDIDVRIVEINGRSRRMYLLQGESYAIAASKVVSNEGIGAADTQFDITEIVAGVTYRYTYDSTGTDPIISATTVPIGIEVTIKDTGMASTNEGKFTVTGSGANYFEVSNASGTVEANKTIGASGVIIPHSLIPEDYISVKF